MCEARRCYRLGERRCTAAMRPTLLVPRVHLSTALRRRFQNYRERSLRKQPTLRSSSCASSFLLTGNGCEELSRPDLGSRPHCVKKAGAELVPHSPAAYVCARQSPRPEVV